MPRTPTTGADAEEPPREPRAEPLSAEPQRAPAGSDSFRAHVRRLPTASPARRESAADSFLPAAELSVSENRRSARAAVDESDADDVDLDAAVAEQATHAPVIANEERADHAGAPPQESAVEDATVPSVVQAHPAPLLRPTNERDMRASVRAGAGVCRVPHGEVVTGTPVVGMPRPGRNPGGQSRRSWAPHTTPSPIVANSDGTFSMRTGPGRVALGLRIFAPFVTGSAAVALAAFVSIELARDKRNAGLAIILGVFVAVTAVALGVAAHAAFSEITATYQATIDPHTRTLTVAPPVCGLRRVVTGALPSNAHGRAIPVEQVGHVRLQRNEVGCDSNSVLRLVVDHGDTLVLGTRLTGCLAADPSNADAIVEWWCRACSAASGRGVGWKGQYDAL